jgi:hypothetical protein
MSRWAPRAWKNSTGLPPRGRLFEIGPGWGGSGPRLKKMRGADETLASAERVVRSTSGAGVTKGEPLDARDDLLGSPGRPRGTYDGRKARSSGSSDSLENSSSSSESSSSGPLRPDEASWLAGGGFDVAAGTGSRSLRLMRGFLSSGRPSAPAGVELSEAARLGRLVLGGRPRRAGVAEGSFLGRPGGRGSGRTLPGGVGASIANRSAEPGFRQSPAHGPLILFAWQGRARQAGGSTYRELECRRIRAAAPGNAGRGRRGKGIHTCRVCRRSSCRT